MNVMIDTSVWLQLLKDRSGAIRDVIKDHVGDALIVMLPPIRLELLQGCRGEPEWRAMLAHFEGFDQVQMDLGTWDRAARIYFELRQAGWTVRSALDCCIASACIDHGIELIHADQDFETIAKVRPLKHRRLNLDIGTQ